MGKKAKWFSAVKKAFHSPFKSSEKSPGKTTDNIDTPEREPGKSTKEKQRWSFGKSPNKELSQDFKPVSPHVEQHLTEVYTPSNHLSAVPPVETKTDAAAVASENDVGTKAILSDGDKSREEWAAIRIQTAIRGYLARRALRALRGLARLQALVHGPAVRRQATTALRYMQSLVKVQARVRARRVRMSEEGQAIQRQLWERRQQEMLARKSTSDGTGAEGWNESTQSAEEIQARIQSRQEAAVKRERALAYAFSHQLWRSAPNEASLFLDCESDKPYWGWSWLDRWMTGRPWEARLHDKENHVRSIEALATKFTDNDPGRVNKSGKSRIGSLHVAANRALNGNASPLLPAAARVMRPLSIQISSTNLRNTTMMDEDGNGEARSTPSIRATAIRFGSRSSYASSIWDEESLAASIPAHPNYMSATQSAQAKSRSRSALKQRPGQSEKELLSTSKKRWSYPITSSPPSNGNHELQLPSH